MELGAVTIAIYTDSQATTKVAMQRLTYLPAMVHQKRYLTKKPFMGLHGVTWASITTA